MVETFIKKVQIAHTEGDIRELSTIYDSICCIRYINSQTIRKDRRIETDLYKKENLLLFNLMSQIMVMRSKFSKRLQIAKNEGERSPKNI
ncbi:hypothetical protein LCGC14_2206040 [marine sediment metagenome]|uniref:Uncharacterized protein n=1 Tax=marine sediment metagenome TaxID=412755 RepID=A0A0F9DF61_9ZZZZ